ncbi:uncharacterized protein [Antennarius striatus]|uniref:uncharacterized protein n=1 Tax=Antennarius striatus TaxID=241820 RepID=UPI0035AF6F2B
MSKEKTRPGPMEAPEPDTSLMIVKSIPGTRTVRLKKNKITASNNKCLTTKNETSGNILRLCVNLMPVLAAAKELVDEEERKEEDHVWSNKKKPETKNINDLLVPKVVEQKLHPKASYAGLNLDKKQSLQFVLPPVSVPTSACFVQQKTRCRKPLPPISLTEQMKTIAPNLNNEGNGLVTGQDPDCRPLTDNPLFSKSRSAEFGLPDISLSSLDALLQAVSQKLRRKKSTVDEGPWSEVMKETSEYGWQLNRWKSLPPLLPAPKPRLILTMTKKNCDFQHPE